MYSYGLDCLENYFHENSIHTLQCVFDKFNNPFLTEAEKIQLQSDFLSVIRNENNRGIKHAAVSPNGMNFIYCLFESGQYILMNMDGITVLFQNWMIFEGELDICNVQWIEKDSLVVFDLFYIVRSEIQKCICHFSNDSSAFIYFTDIRKVDRRHCEQAPLFCLPE